MTITEDRRQEMAPTTNTGITIETALYAAVLGLGLFLRLYRLGLAPLSEHEAAQALAALQGGVAPIGGSSLLHALNTILMGLFSPGDEIVRLAPALVGSLLASTPFFFRDALGRVGALGAALILAISPLGLVASRSLDGQVLVAACALTAIGLARRYLSTGASRQLILAACALGIGLASGPGMLTAVFAMLAGLLVLRIALGGEVADAWRSARARLVESSLPAKLAIAVVGSFVLAATGGLMNLPGLGAAADSLTAWLSAFRSGDGSSAFAVLQILIVYEPLALLAGTAGLAWTLLQYRFVSPVPDTARERRSDLFGAGLGFVSIIALVIVVMQTGRRPIDLLLPMSLLAVLAGYAIEAWFNSVRAKARLPVDGIVVSVGALVLAFAAQALAAYVRGRYLPGNTLGLSPEVSVFVLLGAVFVLTGGVLAMTFDLRAALRGAASVLLVALVMLSLSAGWGAAQVRVGDAREIIWGSSVTTAGARLLADTAQQIAIRSQGHARTLPVSVEVDDPIVKWYLRDARVPRGAAAAGVVTAGGPPSTPDANFIGTQIMIREKWDAGGLHIDTWLGWALFRDDGGFPTQATLTVTLWERR